MGPRCRRKGVSTRTLARGPLGMPLRPTRGPGMRERCAPLRLPGGDGELGCCGAGRAGLRFWAGEKGREGGRVGPLEEKGNWALLGCWVGFTSSFSSSISYFYFQLKLKPNEFKFEFEFTLALKQIKQCSSMMQQRN